MQKDLSSILDYFNILKKVKVAKNSKTTNSPGVLIRESKHVRKDEVLQKPTSLVNNLVAQAPDKKDGYIKVKSIL